VVHQTHGDNFVNS